MNAARVQILPDNAEKLHQGERKSRRIKADRVAKIFRFARLILASSKEVLLFFHHLFESVSSAFLSDQLRRRRGSS